MEKKLLVSQKGSEGKSEKQGGTTSKSRGLRKKKDESAITIRGGGGWGGGGEKAREHSSIRRAKKRDWRLSSWRSPLGATYHLIKDLSEKKKEIIRP